MRNIGAFQVVTTVLKFVPLVFMATVGLLFIKSANFGSFNASGRSALGAISRGRGASRCSATSAWRPRRSPPGGSATRTATSPGPPCSARWPARVVYILGTLTVFGTVPHGALVASTAPFTDSANAIFGGRWAGDTVAVAAIVSGLGALNGWTLIFAEMPKAAARDRLFPAPFASQSRRGVPVFGIVVGTVLASVITVVSYTSFDTVFTTVVLLSVLTAVIPYLFSAAAQLYWLRHRGPRGPGRTWSATSRCRARAGFLFWSLAGSGYQAVYYGLFCLLLGVPVYVWLKAERREYGETPVKPRSTVDGEWPSMTLTTDIGPPRHARSASTPRSARCAR